MRVSILTRPGGRVQLRSQFVRRCRQHSFNPHPSRRTGATDIRCTQLNSIRGFNPHPSRRTGATIDIHRFNQRGGEFQSSPVPEDGCNCARLSLLTTEQHQFQSSPVPEDGCNMYRSRDSRGTLEFQSSPVPEDGCNRVHIGACLVCRAVSILTRPGGRVQRLDTVANR